MRYMLNVEEQREQFKKVIDYLKSGGNKRKEIGARLGIDNITLSHLCSGTIKYISDEVLDNLNVEYNINPRFIRYGSECMFDIPQIKFENFEQFVDRWDVVDHEGKSYLHFSMDENFYNFLLDVYTFMESQSAIKGNNKSDAFKKAFESLKNSYPSKAINKNYVLIPADRMEEIAETNKRRRKELNEVIDFLKL